MQANPQSIDDIFKSQVRYVVPMFQRLYVWQREPQWQALWEDLAEKAELQIKGVKSNAHYLGALIIEGVPPKTPREVKRFLIIDGQQRLTTLQLMISAFRGIARDRGWQTLERATRTGASHFRRATARDSHANREPEPGLANSSRSIQHGQTFFWENRTEQHPPWENFQSKKIFDADRLKRHDGVTAAVGNAADDTDLWPNEATGNARIFEIRGIIATYNATRCMARMT